MPKRSTDGHHAHHAHALRADVPSGAPRSDTFRALSLGKVVTHPDPRLQGASVELDPCAPFVVALAELLVTTMRVSPACIGLAAPQIGEPSRVFCMDVTGHRHAQSCAGLVVMVNPKIVERRGHARMREGCMSVPDLTGDVVRAREVTVEGYEPGTGKLLRVEADAMEARCLQHEIDHLDGLLFVDRVMYPERELFARKRYA